MSSQKAELDGYPMSRPTRKRKIRFEHKYAHPTRVARARLVPSTRKRYARSKIPRPRFYYSKGVPPRMYMTLRGTYHAAYAPAAQTGQILLGLNQPKDPFLTLAATQTLLYDEMAALYTHCCVTGGTLHVKFIDGAAASNPTTIGVYFDTNSSHIGTMSDVASIPGSSIYVTCSDEKRTITFTRNFDTATILGHPIDIVADSEEMNVGTPSELIYAHLCASNLTENIVGQYLITINFNCVFTRPKLYHTQST